MLKSPSRVRCKMPATVSPGSLLLVGGPECQVVTEQLHDEGRILVAVFGDVVKLCNCILESCAGHLACLVRILQDLVLEHRIVQCKAKTDGVSYGQILFSHIRCFLVSEACILRGFALGIASAEFSNVSVVVGLHLLVEDLRLPTAALGIKLLSSSPRMVSQI